MLRVVGTASRVARVSVLLLTVVVSISGDCPVTEPTLQPPRPSWVTSSRAENPTDSVTPSRISDWNPVRENAMR